MHTDDDHHLDHSHAFGDPSVAIGKGSAQNPFPDEIIGFHSNHGIRPGHAQDTFQLKTNEDRAAVTFIPADESREAAGHQMVFQV